MQSQSLCGHISGFIQGFSGADDTRKIGKRYAVVAVGIFVDQGDILSHSLFILRCWQGGPQALSLICIRYFSFRPACFSMLLNVPTGTSLLGCGTVTRPGLFGCLNWT